MNTTDPNMIVYYDIATKYQPLSKEEQHAIWIEKVLPFQNHLILLEPKQLSLFDNEGATEPGVITDDKIRRFIQYNPLVSKMAKVANDGINELVYHNMQLILSVINRYSKTKGLAPEDFIIPCIFSARRAIQRYRYNAENPAKIGNWLRFWVDGTCKKLCSKHSQPLGEYRSVSLDGDESILQIEYTPNDNFMDACLSVLSDDDQKFLLDYLSLADNSLGMTGGLDERFNKIVAIIKNHY